MASPNPNISNGTCYYAENTVTKGDFIPCGNDAIAVWPCCLAGSFCLGLGDSNSCWDAKSGNTYVAGCTDPSFGSPECLHKPPPFHDQEWVAINQACKNLNDPSDDVTNWTGCRVEDDSVDLFKLPMASCTAYCDANHILYAGSSTLEAYASLPTISGSSIFWQNNYEPQPTPAAGYTPGTTNGVVPTGRPTSSPGSDGDDGGLSKGAKIGIGVGAGVGGLIIIVTLIAVLIFCLRKRKPRQQDSHLSNTFQPAAGSPLYARVGQSSPPPPAFITPASHPSPNHIVEFPADPPANDAYGPYTGYKSELPADEHPLFKYPSQTVTSQSTGSPPLSSATMTVGGSSPSSMPATRAYSQRTSHSQSTQTYTDTLPAGATLEPPQIGDGGGGGGGYYYYDQHQQQQPQRSTSSHKGPGTPGIGPIPELHG